MKTLSLAITATFLLASCNTDKEETRNYRQDMRDFVIGISQYAKNSNPDFAVIPQNGIELVSETSDEGSPLSTDYLNAIDAHGQESLFYGYNNDDEATPVNETEWLLAFLDRSMAEGNKILVTDYCSSQNNMANSYVVNHAAGYVSFAADQRALNNIPNYPYAGANANTISSISETQNFLYLINPENFATKQDLINAVTATNYDVVIMDLFSNENEPYTAVEVDQLRQKANGGSRIVVCYMSIGEAEDYRYYWQSSWSNTPPSWLSEENPDWEGNYKVKYWDADWQSIIYGNQNAYLDKILAAGFDGVYLDIIDAFEYFENQ
jgi:cysteinyl-tRNA synthetase